MLLLHVSLLLKLILHILLASEVMCPPLAFTLSLCSASHLSSHVCISVLRVAPLFSDILLLDSDCILFLAELMTS